MKKKLKLFASLASLCLSMAVLCFGVFAAVNVNYKLNGTVSYTVSDAFVKLQTTVYSSEQLMNLQTLKQNVNDLSQGTISQDISQVQQSEIYDSSQVSTPPQKVELNLTFSADAMTYFIVFNIKNLSDINVWSILQDKITTYTGTEEGCYTPENVLIFSNEYQLQIAKDEVGKNIVVGLTVEDVTTSIPENTLFQYGIKVGINDYATSQENLSKFNFTGKTNSNTSQLDAETNYDYYTVEPSENATGFAVMPDYYPVNNQTQGKPVMLPEFNEANVQSGVYVSHDVGLGAPIYVGPFAINGAAYSTLVLNNQTEITSYALAGCSGIQRIVLNPNTSSVGFGAFLGCGIREITLPQSIQNITRSTVNMGSDIENVSGVLAACQNLVEATINCNVTDLGALFFYGCSNLMQVKLPSTLTALTPFMFTGCHWLGHFEIPHGILLIGDDAFAMSGITSVYIPNTVTLIGDEAFTECSILEEVIFEENSVLDEIKHQAFLGTKFTHIDIPASVTKIGGDSFGSALKTVKFYSTTPENISVNNTGFYVFENCTVYVPTGTIDGYKTILGENNNFIEY